MGALQAAARGRGKWGTALAFAVRRGEQGGAPSLSDIVPVAEANESGRVAGALNGLLAAAGHRARRLGL